MNAPTDVTGNSGDRIILQCQVDSNPKAEYVWLKNGDIFEVGIKRLSTLKSNVNIPHISDGWQRPTFKLHSVSTDGRELYLSSSGFRVFAHYARRKSPNERTTNDSWKEWCAVWECRGNCTYSL